MINLPPSKFGGISSKTFNKNFESYESNTSIIHETNNTDDSEEIHVIHSNSSRKNDKMPPYLDNSNEYSSFDDGDGDNVVVSNIDELELERQIAFASKDKIKR